MIGRPFALQRSFGFPACCAARSAGRGGKNSALVIKKYER
jgi:hypothetical protein